MIYELTPAKGTTLDAGQFAKDLMVTVRVPLGRKQRESVVPYSAVVFDPYGGAWIYLDRGQAKSGKQQYERRKVEVGGRVRADVDGVETNCVILRPTLAAGERVVTSGAGILFSREFYQPPVNP